MTVKTKENRRLSRRRRVRAKISGTTERPRISVFRSNRGICAQLVDDVAGNTLAAVNWYEPELRKLGKGELRRAAPAPCWPSAPKRPGSRAPCSTVAGTATTATWPPSPTRSERPGSRSRRSARPRTLPSPFCHVPLL